MFDRREGQFVTYNAFLFDALFSDGFSLEIQVNPEFRTAEAARQQAQKYARLIGQLAMWVRSTTPSAESASVRSRVETT